MQQTGKGNEVHIVSAVHTDGAIVELVECDGTTKLAVADRDVVRIESSLPADEGVRLVPVPFANNLLKHRAVLLPGPPEPYGSVEELIAAIGAYVTRYVDLSPDFLKIATAYVLLSWVYDRFNELPYLRFRGDYGSGKTRALLVVGSLMWKPLFASGASTTSPIFHALDLFRGTLIVDESDFRVSDEKADLVKILNQGNVRGFPVLRSQATPQKTFDPRAFYVYGPKLVGMRHSFSDQALESRFLTEEMGQRPLPKDIPINLPDCQAEQAGELRAKLLQYRFDSFHATHVRADAYDASLSPRANQVMTPLISVVSDPELRECIRRAMRGTESMLHAERAASTEGSLLAVILELQHATPAQSITVGDIARLFRLRHGADYERPITPRYVGYLIRNRLHLKTTRRSGVWTLRAESEALEALARRFGGEA